MHAMKPNIDRWQNRKYHGTQIAKYFLTFLCTERETQPASTALGGDTKPKLVPWGTRPGPGLHRAVLLEPAETICST